ncbi:MAG: 4Fe-4S dicluster domain-containing protein [Bacteroidales bacterium]|nr:4Fe-4S dicluster domain-containing protein [Bacteroidales bacterium]
MAKGFIFKYDLCVACNACAAACYLENKGEMPWRKVLTDNPEVYPGLPVHNISMACNHCEHPVCMESCPAGAYSIDNEFNAVILDAAKCIGCNYCYWNCPYDAPQYNNGTGTIEKCHLCTDRLRSGILPACTSACPTGALSYDEISDTSGEAYNINPNDLKPALNIINPRSTEAKPLVYPGNSTESVSTAEATQKENSSKHEVSRKQKILQPGVLSRVEVPGPVTDGRQKVKALCEWPLILFTLLSSVLFSLSFSAWKGYELISAPLYMALLLAAALLSLFHLGKPLLFYRSLINLSSSPLSREIAAFSAFAVFSSLAMMFRLELLWMLAFISGLLMLAAIDAVYVYSDKRPVIRYHNAQVFLTGLLLSSFLIAEPLPFIFIGVLKLLYLLVFKIIRLSSPPEKIFSLAYTGCLLYVSYSLFSPMPALKMLIIFAILLVFELGMRIIFYFDFSPVSLRFDFSRNKNKYEEDN